MCWAVWDARNRWVFEGEVCDPHRSVEYVNKLMAEIHDDEGESMLVSGHSPGKWSLPEEGMVKFNTDMGCLDGLGSTVGVVARDVVGEVRLAGVWMVADRWDLRIGEAKVALMGLQVAVEYGHRWVVMESDFLNLVNAIRVRERGDSHFHLILEDIYHVSSLLEVVDWNYVGRKGNRVAHELAHCLPWRLGRQVWENSYPPCISSLLASDLSRNEN